MAIDAAELLGITDEMIAEISKEPEMDRGICWCGHSQGGHDGPACVMLKGKCGCTGYAEVVRTEDARYFRRSTSGPGIKHALTQAIAKCREHDILVTWTGQTECWIPGCENPGKTIVGTTTQGMLATVPEDAHMSGMLCERHAQATIAAGWVVA